MAAAATVQARQDDRYKVVPLQGVAAALDEHGIGAKVAGGGGGGAEKICTDCGQSKPLPEFWFVGRSGKRQDICGTCMRIRAEKGREASGKPRTMGAEIQQLMREASKPVEAPEKPPDTPEPAPEPIAAPPPLERQDEAPSTSPQVPPPAPLEQVEVTDDWASDIEGQIEGLAQEVDMLGQSVKRFELGEFSMFEGRTSQYFDLLLDLARSHAYRADSQLWPLLDRMEKQLAIMREHEQPDD